MANFDDFDLDIQKTLVDSKGVGPRMYPNLMMSFCPPIPSVQLCPPSNVASCVAGCWSMEFCGR